MDEIKLKLNKKPPLGVAPEYFYEKQRILDLARAIHEYVYEDDQTDYLEKWAEELLKRIRDFSNLSKMG